MQNLNQSIESGVGGPVGQPVWDAIQID
jgi:hypothetical protein